MKMLANVGIMVCARGSGMFDFIELNLRVRYGPMKVHAQSLRNRLAGEILKKSGLDSDNRKREDQEEDL